MTQIHAVADPVRADETGRAGNQTVLGRRLAIADWRQLQALLASIRLPLDEARRVALVDSSRQLDAWLGYGPSVLTDRDVHRVEVFGTLVCSLTEGNFPRLQAEYRNRHGHLKPLHATFSFLPALRGVWWLSVVLDAWGTQWRSKPPSSPDPADAQERLVLYILRRMLDADGRFRPLCAQLARLVLGEQLLSLAARSRIPQLDNHHVQRVMTYRALCEEVARVHPTLLQMLTVMLRDFAPMCEKMVKDGLSPRAMFADFVCSRSRACPRVRGPGWSAMGSASSSASVMYGPGSFACESCCGSSSRSA